jgi:peptidoglycan/LPS O-acetylase OafA/YrhL
MIKEINFFRFLASMIVVNFHVFKKYFEFNGVNLDIFTNGPLMVYFFITLSGFMLSHSYYKKENYGYREYLLPKMLKIVLVSWIVFSASMLYYDYNFITLILEFSFFQSYFPKYATSGIVVSWYLTFHVTSIIIFPLLLKLQKYKPILFSVTSLIMLLYVSYLSKNLLIINSSVGLESQYFIHGLVYYFPLMLIPTFMIGMCFSRLVFLFENANKAKMTIIMLIAFAVLFYGVKISTTNFYSSIFFGIFILSLSKENLLTFMFDNKLIRMMGSISFPIFLIHIPLFEILNLYNIYNQQIYFILLFTISIILHFVLEKFLYKIIIRKIKY